jgi:large subunit ribosomal protein L22
MFEARALHKNIRSSPRKMRLVIDQIRGRNVNDALGMLRFTVNHAARDAEQTLRSAVANLMDRYEEELTDTDNVYVKEVYVNQGPTIRRIRPADRGRAYRIRKRSNHLTVVVAAK